MIYNVNLLQSFILTVYSWKKYYLQVYLDTGTYKIGNKKMRDFPDGDVFQD